MWCEGTPQEKASEFYEILNDDRENISCSDKDFKETLYRMFYIASEMVFLNASDQNFGGKLITIRPQDIETAKEKYDELKEEFLDEVFGSEARLDRTEWETNVVQYQAYLFSPELIRQKLEYESYTSVIYYNR